MTIDEKKQYEESNIAVVTAVPEPGMITAVGVKEDGIPAAAGPAVPPGHARFYCEKCRSPYDLPSGATTWRCAGCHTFNSTTPGEQCCTLM